MWSLYTLKPLHIQAYTGWSMVPVGDKALHKNSTNIQGKHIGILSKNLLLIHSHLSVIARRILAVRYREKMKQGKHQSIKVKTIIVFPFKGVWLILLLHGRKGAEKEKKTQMVTEKPSSASPLPLVSPAAEAGPPACRANASTYLRWNRRSTLPIYLPSH